MLKDLFTKFTNNYLASTREEFTNHPIGTLVRATIPNEIFKTNIINENDYQIKGSVGQGNWAAIPWICIFDKKITTTAQEGIYIVYLLSKNGESLYLTLNQGCTKVKNDKGKIDAIQYLHDTANKIQQKIKTTDFQVGPNINLGSDISELGQLYTEGTIFFKEYKQNLIPEDNVLQDDLKKMISLYKEYANTFLKDEKTLTPPQNSNEVLAMKEDLSNEIYYGVPGTGKTYKIQQDYINNPQKEENTITITFHQSFSYEEFVEGIRAKVNASTNQIEYKVEPGIFYKACEKAAKLAGYDSILEMIEDDERAEKIQDAIDNGKIVYFCIDEINRGNIASIFGELISLIEVSKRCGADPKTELVVTLPYSGQKFAVPANLKIIGTMNTADRSIQLLDSALRRRFRFIECKPEYSGYNQKASRILKSINNRIRVLLGKDYQIGQAYFINISSENEDVEIFECLRDKIIPLLEEYFYGETQKIRMVLNEYEDFSNSTANSFYMEDNEAINSMEDYVDSPQIYKLNENLLTVKTTEQAKNFIDHIE
ncbi:DUF3578 domain-containing protein [Treponema sp.]|uniref:MrcB family domain-containing protein n=1 Tax=Treponema sp. TaxID=166 RepID=UPI0025F4E5CC|nr:DUF3578 domain-containing protein [Treponema sp.]MCR5218694.1 DUF3578 domain-containing protein [Treponema sp.]